MLEDIRKNFLEEEFKIIYFLNNIDILNYKKLISIKDNEIVLESSNKKIVIEGNNLVIIKLVKDELLINGDIKCLNIN